MGGLRDTNVLVIATCLFCLFSTTRSPFAKPVAPDCEAQYAYLTRPEKRAFDQAFEKGIPLKINGVMKTYGMRLLLAQDLPNQSQKVWNGFGRVQGRVQKWAVPLYPFAYPIRSASWAMHKILGTYEPNFTYPSIVRGTLENTYFAIVKTSTRPLRKTLLKHFGDSLRPEFKAYLAHDLKPSGLVNFGLAMVSFNLLYKQLNSWYQDYTVSKQKSWIDESSEHWLGLLDSDPYYSRLFALQQNIPKHELVQEVFLRTSGIDLLYMLINDRKNQDLDLPNKILTDPEFRETFKPVLPGTFYLAENPPESGENFDIPKDQIHPATHDQLEELINVNLRLLKRRSPVRAFFEEPKLFEKLQKMSNHSKFAKEIFSDPQIKFYLDQAKEKKISAARARYLCLEWTLVKERFERWAIFKAQRMASDGKTRRPVSATDLYDWRRSHLNEELPYDFANSDIYPALKIQTRERLDRPLYSYLNKLVFLRSVEPGTRQIWNALEQSVQFMGAGSVKSGVLGEEAKLATTTGAASKTVEYVGSGGIARTMAYVSSAVVYADLGLRWVELEHIKSFVEKTGSDVLFLDN